MNELRSGAIAAAQALLGETDLLVAGPYLAGRPPSHPLLSSDNQKLVFLSPRYRSRPLTRRRTCAFHIRTDGTIHCSGFPQHPLTDRGWHRGAAQ